MGFSGIRAVILIAVLIGLVMAVSRFDLPGWLVPLGLGTGRARGARLAAAAPLRRVGAGDRRARGGRPRGIAVTAGGGPRTDRLSQSLRVRRSFRR